MKIDLRTLIILLSIVFNLYTQVLAGDSVGFSISCTIPEIPGVNAPLKAEIKAQPEKAEVETESQNSSPSPEAEKKEIFIEEIQETQIAQGADPTLIKVIYSR